MRPFIILGVLTAIAACSAPPKPPPPTVVELTLTATPDVNPTPSGQGAPIQGAPLVVRVYQLGSTSAFTGAEFFPLFNQDQATLGTDLVKRDELTLVPGQTKTLTLTPTEPVKAVGVFAAYRDFQHATWRAAPIPAAPDDQDHRDGRRRRHLRQAAAIRVSRGARRWDGRTRSSGREGLFLQPQHLQQQERYFERLVRGSTAGLRPFGWGLTQLDIDTDLLALGKFARPQRVAGMLPDGTPFSMPGDVDHPDARSTCRRRVRNSHVYLLLPTRQPGGVETAPADRTGDRRRASRSAEHEAMDTNAGYQCTATVPIGRLRLRFALEGEARGRHAALGLARDRRGARRQERGAGRGLHPAAAGLQRLRPCLPAS